MLKRSLLAALSGMALGLAFEPVAVAALIPVAVAGLVLSTGAAPNQAPLRLRAGLGIGLVFGLAFYSSHVWWMRSVGVSAWIGTSVGEALFYGLTGAFAALLQRHRLWPLWFAAAWTTIEALRSSWPFSGMPWGRLAFGVIDTPVAEAMPYVGTLGVSFALALLGALLAWLVRGPIVGERGRRTALAGAVGLVALLGVPALWPWQVDQTGSLTVAAVQGDVPGDGDDILYDFRQVTSNHVDATVELGLEVDAGTRPRPDLVLWPENSTAVDPFADAETNAGIRAASAAIGVPILVGAIVDAGPDHVLNQGIVWDPVTGAGQRYTKWHPVAFGEYIPFRTQFEKVMDGRNLGRLAEVGRDMLSGDRADPLDIGGVPIADAICFDIAYDDGLRAQLRNGAELLVVQSSNATFIHTDQIDQQFAITRLRAIETGRWVVVATTNGVSGVISPDGEVVATAEPQTTAVLLERVGLIRGLTPAMGMGAWPGRGVALLAGIGVLCALVLPRRTLSERAADRSQAAPELQGSPA